MRGRVIPLSLPKRWVIDMLHFACCIPTVPVQKRILVSELVAARAASSERPRWTAIFTKAYALTAQEFPELRRAYVKIPWPHLYEFSTSKACIIIERDYQGEAAIWPFLIKDPALRPLSDISRELEYVATAPLERIKDFRRCLRLARLPRPVRRALWWTGLNIGRQRGNYFGTFVLSVYSALKVESLHPLSPLTTMLNYGVLSTEGTLDVRIIYDHRVMNGATVARALGRLEQILNTDILNEIRERPTRTEASGSHNSGALTRR
jgi:hypothetical protein